MKKTTTAIEGTEQTEGQNLIDEAFEQIQEEVTNGPDDGSHKCDTCTLEFATCESKSVQFGIDRYPDATGKEADRVISCGAYNTATDDGATCFNTNCEFYTKENIDGCGSAWPEEMAGNLSCKCVDFVNAATFLDEAVPPSIFVCGDTSEVFKRELPVALTGHELEVLGAEMARLIGICTRAKLEKQAYDKAAKGLIDQTEENYIEVAAKVAASTEERQVDCYWQYDSAHCLKRLFRCDTGEMVEELPMTSSDMQKDLNFQTNQSEENVLAMAEEGAADQLEQTNQLEEEAQA